MVPFAQSIDLSSVVPTEDEALESLLPYDTSYATVKVTFIKIRMGDFGLVPDQGVNSIEFQQTFRQTVEQF